MNTSARTDVTRGRAADSPHEIPPIGWWDVTRRVAVRISGDNMTILAAGVAFYAMLAVFPFIGATVTLYAVVSDPGDLHKHLDAVSVVMPEDVTRIFDAQLRAIATGADERFGLPLLAGLAFAIWSAHRGVVALVVAVTVAYHEKETRNYFTLNALTYVLTLGAILMVVTALLLLIGLPTLLHFIDLSSMVGMVTQLLTFVLLFFLLIISTGLLYRFGPPRRPARWRWLSTGAVAATFFWLAGSIGFSLYVSNFGSYNETYGTLGAIIVLLLWFFMSGFSVILGALINAELEMQTIQDTTLGWPRPRGRRGAFVADNHAGSSAVDDGADDTTRGLE